MEICWLEKNKWTNLQQFEVHLNKVVQIDWIPTNIKVNLMFQNKEAVNSLSSNFTFSQ
jgi:hypothetical protein